MRKILLILMIIPLISAGCTQILDGIAENESHPEFFPPPNHHPVRIGECLLEYDCPHCGECLPVEIKTDAIPYIMPLPAPPIRVKSVYRCQNTGRKFELVRNQCDQIVWKDYWNGGRLVLIR